MLTSHGLILKYRHDARFNFGDVTIWYVDRGAQGDLSKTGGSDIRALESHYFEIESATGVKRIPYHRIRKIAYEAEIVWER